MMANGLKAMAYNENPDFLSKRIEEFHATRQEKNENDFDALEDIISPFLDSRYFLLLNC